eukprot:scaffold25410_cov117-Cylindrotheca_fusiformis.AAC.6
MPPQEDSSDVGENTSLVKQLSVEEEPSTSTDSVFYGKREVLVGVGLGLVLLFFISRGASPDVSPTGPYKLVELHQGVCRRVSGEVMQHKLTLFLAVVCGRSVLAGYNSYVSAERARALGLAKTTRDATSGMDRVILQSAPGANASFRESIRLEGKRRFDRGLFILDVEHMPNGWYVHIENVRGDFPKAQLAIYGSYLIDLRIVLSDEDDWPKNGEIDILEGINTQSVAKTALHTAADCSMYAHVPPFAKTGNWDSATGIPNTFTGKLNLLFRYSAAITVASETFALQGEPNTFNRVEADNCWVMAPHQWANQGCVTVSSEAGTIGEAMNSIDGGVYALEWDPANGFIKSWVFKRGSIPTNLQDSIDFASVSRDHVVPDPDEWPLPYAYFAIGAGSGCSADHFKNMRLVLNTAFCGTVAGNRFFKDCPGLSATFNTHNDSVLTCNAYIGTDPDALSEAYWKIRGVYVYEREMARRK